MRRARRDVREGMGRSTSQTMTMSRSFSGQRGTDTAGVEPGTVCVSRRGDEEIHHAGTRLATSSDHRSSELTVTARDIGIDRQTVDALDNRQATQSFSSNVGFVGNQDAEVQFRHGGGANRQLSGQLRYPGSEDDAGVEHCFHALLHGSTTAASMRSRSRSQEGSGGPSNRSAISFHVRHVRGVIATSRARGRPETVMVISWPASTRRTSSDAC